MKFLLDTNVISEWVRAVPDEGVVAWSDTVDEDLLLLSVITLAELRHGVERLARGRRRAALERWLDEDLPARFEDRVLDIDRNVAHAWGHLIARAENRGRPLSVMDAFLAATAQVHSLTVVTRNVAHFEGTGVPVHNPWHATPA